jgi:hypothetical protein
MHYLCGGFGNKELAITDLDRLGAQRLYGPPKGPSGLAPTAVGLAPMFSEPLPSAFVR